MKLGDRVKARGPGKTQFVGTVDKVHATGPNPQRPEMLIRVKLDEPYLAAGTSFEFLTFNPQDLEVIP